MSRRRHRRHNPSKDTLMYVGIGIAAIGLIYVVTKGQQAAAPAPLPATAATPGTDTTGQTIGTIASAVGSAVGNYVDNNGG